MVHPVQRRCDQRIDDALLTHLPPLGWEHIHLTGDYGWHPNKRIAKDPKLDFTPVYSATRRLTYAIVRFVR
ncbi:MAG TPA: hypothetical protein VGD78_16610 [Chthoniobacterales bacterium]